MTRQLAGLGAGLFLTAWLLAAGAASAQDATLQAFFGQWQGSGISKTDQSLYFGETVRDFDVEIRAEGQGFRVAWTTVLRQGGDPNNPDVRRRSAERGFSPSGNGRYFVASDSGNPLTGGDMAWARLEKRTLTIYIMTIAEDGLYDMQIYARTLEAPGMTLRFTRIRGDEPQRTVEGRLVKIKN